MHSKNRKIFKLRTEPDDILVGLGGELRRAWRVQTEEAEEAEGLKREITTAARGLRIEEQNIGERKEQRIEE